MGVVNHLDPINSLSTEFDSFIMEFQYLEALSTQSVPSRHPMLKKASNEMSFRNTKCHNEVLGGVSGAPRELKLQKRLRPPNQCPLESNRHVSSIETA